MPKKITADRSLLVVITILLLLGIIMIYDGTVVFAQGTFGEAYKFVILHIGWIFIGLIVFSFFYKFDYHKLENYVYPLFGLAILPLILLAFVSLLRKVGLVECNPGHFLVPCINGASRWLYINFSFLQKVPFINSLGFQPAEFAKISLIMFLAVALDRLINLKGRVANRTQHKYQPLYFTLIVTGVVSALIFLQPNLSTATLVFIIGISVYFASGLSLKPLLVVLPVLFSTGMLFILSSSYRRARLLTLINGSGNELETGYHIKQILIALGSGGVFGLGFGQSRQKFQYLPEIAADSIFAIIGEELGFLGTTIVIGLFLFLLSRGYYIANNAPDLLGKLLAVGVTTWIGFQFFVNVAAMTRLIPLTGVPLPLISYGGSSTIFTLMGLGILANISKQIK